jgi:hypothetical protein
MSRAARIGAALEPVIRHRRYVEAFDAAKAVIARDVDARGNLVPVLGPTRTGKTRLARDLQAGVGAIPQVSHRVPTRLDFAIGAVPPKPNDRDLYRALLLACGFYFFEKEKTNQLRRRLVEMIRDNPIRVIALDECNHFAETGINLSARGATDHLKSLVDETGVNLLLLGLPSFQSLLDKNEQFRDRAHATIPLHAYDWNAPQDREDFYAAFLAIVEDDCLRRVYGLSGGRVGLVLRLMLATAQLVKGRKAVTLKDLRRAARTHLQKELSPDTYVGEEPPTDTALIRAHVRMLGEAGMATVVRDMRDVAAQIP